MNIHDVGEDELIETLLKQTPVASGASGPGDDCAVLERDGDQLQLLKTDAMVEGVHWAPDNEAHRVGWKAVARVVSDIAAMGGQPKEFLITLAMPKETAIDWPTELYRGIGNCLNHYGGVIVGGETTSCPAGSPIFISVAASGEVARRQVIFRSGAQPGDSLLVTGKLGGSLAGKHLDFRPRLMEADWLTNHFKPTAMMDLSDGLAKDLPRLAVASNCGFTLTREGIPCTDGYSIEQALTDGEDYELLFAIATNRVPNLLEAWARQFGHVPLSVIGELCQPGEGDALSGGWDHFGSKH